MTHPKRNPTLHPMSATAAEFARVIAGCLKEIGYRSVRKSGVDIVGVDGWVIRTRVMKHRSSSVGVMITDLVAHTDDFVAVVHSPDDVRVAVLLRHLDKVVDEIVSSTDDPKVASAVRKARNAGGRWPSNCGRGSRDADNATRAALKLDDWLLIMLGWRSFALPARRRGGRKIIQPGGPIPLRAHDYNTVREAMIHEEIDRDQGEYGHPLVRSSFDWGGGVRRR